VSVVKQDTNSIAYFVVDAVVSATLDLSNFSNFYYFGHWNKLLTRSLNNS